MALGPLNRLMAGYAYPASSAPDGHPVTGYLPVNAGDPLNELAPPLAGVANAPPSGLSHIEAGPRANYMAAADAAMKLSPQEKYLYQTHLTNLYGPGKVVHPDGSISSLLQMSFDRDGRTYSIPTIWGGRALGPNEAIREAERTGGLDRFPSYPSGDEAEARYQQMHDYLGRDTAEFIQRSGR